MASTDTGSAEAATADPVSVEAMIEGQDDGCATRSTTYGKSPQELHTLRLSSSFALFWVRLRGRPRLSRERCEVGQQVDRISRDTAFRQHWR